MVQKIRMAASADEEEWVPVCILPNLELEKGIERAGMAFVPVSDRRVKRLARDHLQFESFIRKFADQFGVPIKPTIVLVKRSVTFNTHLEEVVRGFRDVLVVSTVAYGYALLTVYPGRPRAKFSDIFSIYPWRIDNKFEYLIAQTPAQLSLHEVKEFRGQTSPELFRTRLAESEFDLKLLEVLLTQWEIRFCRMRVKWKERALFRALSMANEASRIPGSAELTIYDLGRSVALWVSAFEILAHPGKGKSGLIQVCDLLDRTKWFSSNVGRSAEWEELRARHLRPSGERPPSSARGVHHVALLCTDVEATIDFYQGLLEFPLTELFENRDYQGSTHFFFDIGNGNQLAFFDMPGLDLGPYAEVLGGLHHLAISVEPSRWQHLKDQLDAAGVPYEHMSGSSLYFTGPDGERIELISDPLGNLYGLSLT